MKNHDTYLVLACRLLANNDGLHQSYYSLLLVIKVFSSPLLDIHGAVGCDLPANFHEPTSLACIANHVANACVRAHATVMQGAFGTCSQQIAFAARFGIG